MDRNELIALITLLDDPDREIFHHVEEKLTTCGPDAVPHLEIFRETSTDHLAKNRAEGIIHKIQFNEIQNEIQLWALQNQEDLLEGLLIINRYQYPDMDEGQIHFQLAELRRNAWYHLMYEMSPIEKVQLLNNVLYREFGLSGNTNNYHDPKNSFISSVLESKKGNPISLACIYSIIAQKLDIPVFGINLPKHFVGAYVEDINQPPLFYINVFNKGQIMKEDDIFAFLKQINLPPKKDYVLPCSNIEILKRVLRNLMTAFEMSNNVVKKNEMKILLNLLEDTSTFPPYRASSETD